MKLSSFGFIVVLVALVAGSGAAQAQSCSFSMTDVNFGLLDPPATSASPYSTATGTFSANCTGDAGKTVYVCAKLVDGTGGRADDTFYFDGGSQNIAFVLYHDSWGYTDVWGNSGATGYSAVALSVALNTSGSGSASQTITAELSVASSVSSGTYVSTFTGSNLSIRYGYTSSSNCTENLGTNTTASFRVMAGINDACLVSATDLDFGEVSSLANGVTGSSTIDVQCTTDLDYSVMLNGGVHGTISERKLAKTGSTATTIAYNLYTDASRQFVWGDSTTGTVSTGKGDGSIHTIPVYGKVAAQQIMPEAGIYTDTVTVTVTY